MTPRTESERRFQVAALLAGMETSLVAEHMNVTRRTVERWIEVGVGWELADEIACRVLNMNPCFLFGPDWEAAAHAVDDQMSLFDDAL